MTNLRTAAQQVLAAMDYMLNNGEWYQAQERADALRAALAEPVQEPDLWGAGYEAGYAAGMAERPAEPVQEPQCNPHPKVPHGFLRNASHTEDRYVCEYLKETKQ